MADPSSKRPEDEKPRAVQPEFERAENEDDDGYDPWSDRIEETPLFEENPWD